MKKSVTKYIVVSVVAVLLFLLLSANTFVGDDYIIIYTPVENETLHEAYTWDLCSKYRAAFVNQYGFGYDGVLYVNLHNWKIGMVNCRYYEDGADIYVNYPGTWNPYIMGVVKPNY